MNEPHRSNLHLLDDPEFKDLAARKNRISLILTVLTLIIYYGFIGLIAFNRELFGNRFFGRITLGIPIGVGVIFLSWVFTGIYVRWANDKYDSMVENIKRKAGLPAEASAKAGHGGP
jgi:uncharacterized membrane protein (DUF485 family)